MSDFASFPAITQWNRDSVESDINIMYHAQAFMQSKTNTKNSIGENMSVIQKFGRYLLYSSIIINMTNAYEANITISREVDRINFKEVHVNSDDQTIHFYSLPNTLENTVNSKPEEVKNYWFTHNDHQIYYKKQRLPNIDLGTLTLYMQYQYPYQGFMDKKTSDVGIYAIDNQQGYYLSFAGASYIINIDKESFVPLNHVYAKDKNHVYFKGKRITQADTESFQILDASWGHPNDRQHYAKDHENVYVRGKVLSKADPKTFRFYTDLGFSHDDQYVFFEDRILEGSDGATFEVISEMSSTMEALYARDQNQAYYGDKILTMADPKTLTGITLDLAKDHQHVYDRGKVVPNVHAETFEVIGPDNSKFFKDKDNVYSIIYDNEPNTLKILKHIDVDTVEFGHYTFVNDKNGCYKIDGSKHPTCQR